MDRDTIMDPAASPARPGVRRVNNLPVVILGGAFAVFLGIMAYVASGRAAQTQAHEEPGAVRSALALAQSVAGDHEAGTVPAAATANTAATVPATTAAARAYTALLRGTASTATFASPEILSPA